MNLKLKRRCTYATILFYNLCCGINYGIIFPTIWDYNRVKFHGNSIGLGFILAAYSISSFIVHPFISYWESQTNNIKIILLFSVFAEHMGSVMYFMGYSSWFLVASRFVSGFGGSATSMMKLDIFCSTLEKDRTTILLLIEVLQLFGLLIGPIFNLFLSSAKFNIGAIYIDKFSSPGLFMAVLWLLVIWSIMLFYHDLSTLKSEEDIIYLFSGYGKKSSLAQEPYQSDFEISTENFMTSSFPNYSSTLQIDNSIKNNLSSSVPNISFDYFIEQLKLTHGNNNSIASLSPKIDVSNVPVINVRKSSEDSNAADNMIESAERFIQSSSVSFRSEDYIETKEVEQSLVGFRRCSEIVENNFTSFNDDNFVYLNPFCSFKSEIIVLVSLVFFTNFSRTFLETIITPLDQRYYNFTEKENSIVYFCIGAELIVLFFFVHYISYAVSERLIILLGIVFLSGSYIASLIFSFDNASGQVFQYFVIIVVLFLFGTSLIMICATSLMFKIAVQDFQVQKYHRIMSSLGCILGPLWGGAYLNQLVYLYAGPLGILCFISVLYICSYKQMKTEDK